MMTMTKQDQAKEIIKAICEGRASIIKTGQGYNREYLASYDRYNLLIDGQIVNRYNYPLLAEHPYYSKRSDSFSMTVWGMSQRFECLYQLIDLLWHTLSKDISCRANNRLHRFIKG